MHHQSHFSHLRTPANITLPRVTEKFFKILDLYLVPNIYGEFDYIQLAPPHSYRYIDTQKFKPKELAAYLKILDTDDALYYTELIFLVKDGYTELSSSIGEYLYKGFTINNHLLRSLSKVARHSI